MNRLDTAYPIARLYCGKVFHARMKPKAHRFTYRVYSIFIDVDRLQDIDRLSPIFSVGRWNLLSFDPRGHGRRDDSSLRGHIDDLLREAGLEIDGGRLFLLCSPRVFGFVFDPISIYWRFDESGALRAIVYEVRNTFGEIHSYVAPVRGDAACSTDLRQTADKRFYVSPFLEMPLTYRFRLAFPDDNLKVRILETDADGPILAAGWSGRASPFNSQNLLRAFLRVPLLTFKVFAAIHWQALRLWLKGVALSPHAATTETRTIAVQPRLVKGPGPQS